MKTPDVNAVFDQMPSKEIRAMIERMIAAELWEKAEEVAQKYLAKAGKEDQNNWDRGNILHHAHQLLGRIALAKGNTALAIEELLEAGKTKGSPQLNSFGPNMLLAKKLLLAGEAQAVLSYLELCGEFWNNPMANQMREGWIAEIKEGKIPDFMGNLIY
ncbi:MAG: hypothetical protein R8P61_01695 [Bacteroidia bacterium]|nr:hypothetical protein [Bacteroidia bacterium]